MDLGLYQHYKGGWYLATSIATHTETGEALVVYHSVPDPSKVWARPLVMFQETVTLDGGQQVPRFRRG